MEKISNGEDKYGQSEEKRTSGEAYDIDKQTIIRCRNQKSNQGRITPRSPHGDVISVTSRQPPRGFAEFISVDESRPLSPHAASPRRTVAY